MSLAALKLSDLKEKAKERPEGYYEDAVSRGKIQGEFLVISVEEVKKLAEKYRPKGLGDYVASMAKPVAKMIDGVLHTDLEHCEECEKRKAWLNKHFPLRG